MQKRVWVRLQSDKHQKTILDNKEKSNRRFSMDIIPPL